MKSEVLQPGTDPSQPAGRGGIRFTLDEGAFAGQSFSAVLEVCGNPCCACATVGLSCRHDAMPDQSNVFHLDVTRRAPAEDPSSIPGHDALARSFVAEARDAEWEWLGRVFISAKYRQMKTMNLDTLEVRFPPEVLSGDGSMLGYQEVFPWAKVFYLSADGVEWFATDQHCVRPGCHCTETGLTFYRCQTKDAPSAEPQECGAFLFFDRSTGGCSGETARPGSPAPDALLQALRSAHPDLAEVLGERHRQLQQLGKRLLPRPAHDARQPFPNLIAGEPWPAKSAVPAVPRRTDAKPGRNDPCPCGSGKKFKKCCGGVG